MSSTSNFNGRFLTRPSLLIQRPKIFARGRDLLESGTCSEGQLRPSSLSKARGSRLLSRQLRRSPLLFMPRWIRQNKWTASRWTFKMSSGLLRFTENRLVLAVLPSFHKVHKRWNHQPTLRYGLKT
ncbi:hypothetical protein FOPG_18685 [Fusarium oxysporum f. sp. conglutinans race 2 54008]|uniref:Uncharacterized protein n=1 Tax=Fusarium oxysporum f. sp. conglutinans race 2 54008 TaxID=1089457 RepID=X0GN53_FUSOX|nr:hypothetical protein FOPG_18685 [Fusarium oxysporum f. sp. conglutinans race 2 54008]